MSYINPLSYINLKKKFNKLFAILFHFLQLTKYKIQILFKILLTSKL